MDKTYDKDLYYVDAKKNKISADEDPWAVYSYENYLKVHGFMLCPNCQEMEVMPGHTCQVCKTVAPTETSAKKATAKAVADAQDVIADNEEINTDINNSVIISENETTASENAIISDNSVSDNNTDITDLETGSDSVFGNDLVLTDNSEEIIIIDDDTDEEFEDDDEDDIIDYDYDDEDGGLGKFNT